MPWAKRCPILVLRIKEKGRFLVVIDINYARFSYQIRLPLCGSFQDHLVKGNIKVFT